MKVHRPLAAVQSSRAAPLPCARDQGGVRVRMLRWGSVPTCQKGETLFTELCPSPHRSWSLRQMLDSPGQADRRFGQSKAQKCLFGRPGRSTIWRNNNSVMESGGVRFLRTRNNCKRCGRRRTILNGNQVGARFPAPRGPSQCTTKSYSLQKDATPPLP